MTRAPLVKRLAALTVDFKATPRDTSPSIPGHSLTTSTSQVVIVTYTTLVCNIEPNEGAGMAERRRTRIDRDVVRSFECRSVEPRHYDTCLLPSASVNGGKSRVSITVPLSPDSTTSVCCGPVR